MTIEGVDLEKEESFGVHDFDAMSKSSRWMGRDVCSNPSNGKEIDFKEIRSFSGSASIEVSGDTEGTTTIEGEIEISNESGNISATGGGGISRDASGNTSAEAHVGITFEW